jgi:hypothetical protein
MMPSDVAARTIATNSGSVTAGASRATAMRTAIVNETANPSSDAPQQAARSRRSSIARPAGRAAWPGDHREDRDRLVDADPVQGRTGDGDAGDDLGETTARQAQRRGQRQQ